LCQRHYLVQGHIQRLLGGRAAAREVQDGQLGAVLLVPWYLQPFAEVFAGLPWQCCLGSARAVAAVLAAAGSMQACISPAAAVLYG
jgi:MFS superfamily sulfate permease-like transporter